MIESGDPTNAERWGPPKRMCYDLLYVYLTLGFILILIQMAGGFLGEYALILTIGVLLSLLLFTLYYVWINPPISSLDSGSILFWQVENCLA
ncbi:MAG: hypothetical protein ACFFAX_10620 [Promethearchaeota archaeon]